jgi:signal transduction histidine kinase
MQAYRKLTTHGPGDRRGQEAVRGLRSSHSLSLDLEQAFAGIQQELAPANTNAAQAGFRVITQGQQKPLHPLLRDEIYRIGREALIDAFRHARARHVEVELQFSPNRFRLLVRDDGCGIDPDTLRTGRDGHWGPSGMGERAQRIGARLQVLSSASAGTEIMLSVPGRIAFEGQPSGRLRWFRKNIGPGIEAQQSSRQNG